MNPAMMNYLQSQQQEGNPQTGQPTQAAAPFNPFDSGIKNAIESARVSLDMTEKQQDKALRRSMLSFGNAYSNEPRQKGFLANFGSVARSLAPAIMEHDDYEDAAVKDNNQLANQILDRQAAAQNSQAQQEERLWHRNHAENQLAEQRRHHNLQNENHKQNQISTTPVEVNGVQLHPITSQKTYDLYLKDKNAFGSTLHQVDQIEDDFKNFEKKYKDNYFDPMSPARKVTNPAKDFLGRFLNNKELQKETADREAFSSRLNQFVTTAEQTLRGGGIVGPRTIELFRDMKIYPSMDDDARMSFEAKLKQIRKELENKYTAANLSLKYKAHIDPTQVESILKTPEDLPAPDEVPPSADNTTAMPNRINQTAAIMMQDAQGNKFQIPGNEVQEAINDGLTPIQE